MSMTSAVSRPSGRWSTIARGTYRVGDAVDVRVNGFEWLPESVLITVRARENRTRVILDGNNRALQLRLTVAAGQIARDGPITVVTGTVSDGGILFTARVIAPLWR